MAGTKSQSQQLMNESIDAVDDKLRAINEVVSKSETPFEATEFLMVPDSRKPGARIS
jgi:hypothetical protein